MIETIQTPSTAATTPEASHATVTAATVESIMHDSDATSEQLRTLPSYNALFAHRVQHKGDSTFLCVAKTGKGAANAAFDYDEYTFKQVDDIAVQLAATYAKSIAPRSHSHPNQVVALLANSGFDYAVNSLAINRLGHAVAYLSTNNSCAALASLVQKTSAKYFIYSPDHANVISELKQLLAQQHVGPVEFIPWSTGADAVKKSPAHGLDISAYTSVLSFDEQGLDPVSIIHSSGSTGFPKPNTMTYVYTLLARITPHWARILIDFRLASIRSCLHHLLLLQQPESYCQTLRSRSGGQLHDNPTLPYVRSSGFLDLCLLCQEALLVQRPLER